MTVRFPANAMLPIAGNTSIRLGREREKKKKNVQSLL